MFKGSTRYPAVAFILFTVLLDFLAASVVIPVFPGLIRTFTADDPVQGALLFGLLGTIWASMQFLFSPLAGALSDRFGRRPVILISNFGLGLSYVLLALAPSLVWLFISRILSGITASSIAAAGAYVADVNPAEKRAHAFSLLGVASGIGFVLGPAMGGVLGNIDLRLPFWVAAGLSFMNGLYGLFVLPESLPREKRKPLSWRTISPVGALKLLRSHPELTGLSIVHFFYTLAQSVITSVLVLYTGYRYDWSERTIGLTLAASGVAVIVVQGALAKPIMARFGERRALVFGLVCAVVGFIFYGVAPTGALFWVGVPILALWGLYGPAAQCLMSRHVTAYEQGQLQGALSSITGITGMIGPALFTLTFAYFIDPARSFFMPGVPFLLAAVFVVISTVLAWFATRPIPRTGE